MRPEEQEREQRLHAKRTALTSAQLETLRQEGFVFKTAFQIGREDPRPVEEQGRFDIPIPGTNDYVHVSVMVQAPHGRVTDKMKARISSGYSDRTFLYETKAGLISSRAFIKIVRKMFTRSQQEVALARKRRSEDQQLIAQRESIEKFKTIPASPKQYLTDVQCRFPGRADITFSNLSVKGAIRLLSTVRDMDLNEE